MDQAQPRPSISDNQPTQGPIPRFDQHLRYLNDSYLSFFQERKRIEDIYVDSLVKLHRKIKTADSALDEGRDLSSTRSAWSEFRDNVEREAQARQAFVNTLLGDVITPLNNLKETQDRTRKRIKEDLKNSTVAYDEYAETMLPKLKARYAKKFAEVEEHKRAASVPVVSPPTPSSEFQPLSNTRSNPAPSRPTVTAPQPLRALDRRPSGSAGAPIGRNRSPPSTGLSDLASQGKRQLNQLITGFLDNRAAGKESTGGGRESQTLRTARAKRELEEADKDYRKGVHWLETLRLQRTKLLESGYKSLETFVEEMSHTVKKVLEQYTDNMMATTTTQTQLSSHARSVVNKISPEKDIMKLREAIPRSLASSIPDPILYVHGHVGECKDLIFGVSLNDYAFAKGLPEGEIPKIVRICIKEIDKRGLESEGVYRVSGRHAVVQAMQHEIEKDEAKFEFKPKDDIFAVASLLKLYLRELPEPVFRYALQDRFEHTEIIAEQRANNFPMLRAKMKPNRMRPVHRATLKALMEHLSRVVAFSEKNKMDAKNLAISFGTAMFGEDEMPKGADLLSVSTWKDTLMEDLIMNAHVIFDERNSGSPSQSSPPLPPTPADEPISPVTYGSKTTKVTNVPPGSPPQDFTPRLPPRPTSSIHPSARSNPTMSPTRETMDPPPMIHEIHQVTPTNSTVTTDSTPLPLTEENPPDTVRPVTVFYEAESSLSQEVDGNRDEKELTPSLATSSTLSVQPTLPPLPPKGPSLHRRIRSQSNSAPQRPTSPSPPAAPST